MRKENPFSLMYGKTPYSLIERRKQVDEIVETFNSNYPSTYSYLISGIRGSGKTVKFKGKSSYYVVCGKNPCS